MEEVLKNLQGVTSSPTHRAIRWLTKVLSKYAKDNPSSLSRRCGRRRVVTIKRSRRSRPPSKESFIETVVLAERSVTATGHGMNAVAATWRWSSAKACGEEV